MFSKPGAQAFDRFPALLRLFLSRVSGTGEIFVKTVRCTSCRELSGSRNGCVTALYSGYCFYQKATSLLE